MRVPLRIKPAAKEIVKGFLVSAEMGEYLNEIAIKIDWSHNCDQEQMG